MYTDIQSKIKPNILNFKDSIVQFKEIKNKAFSGSLIIEIEGVSQWMFSFSLGRLAGVSGGISPVNRWQRNLGIACLDLPLDRLVKTNIQGEIFLNSNTLAQQWVVREIIFDIIQFSQATGDRIFYQIIPITNNNNLLNHSLPLLDIEWILSQSIQDWQKWLNAGLGEYFPSQFLIVSQPDAIDLEDLPLLISAIDGNSSLRTLAIHHQQQLINFTKSLVPLLKSRSIVLSSQPKFSQDRVVNHDQKYQMQGIRSSKNIDQISTQSEIKIACIDDSVAVYHQLEKILTAQGYQTFGVQESIEIIPSLIKNKPNFIFLDLLMPITNGYEVCEQIRKTRCLKDIPVVILTGRDGFIDRMRSKLVGANGFLGKPIQAKSVLKMVDKYLIQPKSVNNNLADLN